MANDSGTIRVTRRGSDPSLPDAPDGEMVRLSPSSTVRSDRRVSWTSAPARSSSERDP